MYLFEQNFFAVFFNFIRSQDQDIKEILMQALEKFILELRERWFKEKILRLVCLPVKCDIYQGFAFFDPVLVNQIVSCRQLRIHKRAMFCIVVLLVQRFLLGFEDLKIIPVAGLAFTGLARRCTDIPGG